MARARAKANHRRRNFRPSWRGWAITQKRGMPVLTVAEALPASWDMMMITTIISSK